MTVQLHTTWLRSEHSDGTRPVIAALHGFFGSPDDWREILAPFAQTHDICLVTLPGHGKNNDSEMLCSFDAMTSALSSILAPYQPSRRILLGYSLGGRIAAYAAFTEQLSIAGIGLLSAHPGLDSEDERWARLLCDDALAVRLDNEPLRAILNEWFQQPLFANELSNDSARERFISGRLQHDSNKLAQALRGFSLGWQPNLWGGLRLFSGQLLYLAGGNDRAYTDIASYVFALHPGRRARILPDVGHDLLGAANGNDETRARLQGEIGELLKAV